MQWKSQERRDSHHALATDPYDKAIIRFAEDLGAWLEEEKQYRDFVPDENLEVDQIGFGLVVLLSEWLHGGLWDLLSGFEKRLVANYVQLQNAAMQEWAASQNHLGEADEVLSDTEE